jgi:hypothetical protein
MSLLRRPALFAANPSVPRRRALRRSAAGRFPLTLPLVLVLAAALVGVSKRVSAQGPVSGALHGQVLDLAGHPLAQVRVVLTPAGGPAASPVSAYGDFLLPEIAPGEYSLTLIVPGFAPLRTPSVEIHLGETYTVKAALRLRSAWPVFEWVRPNLEPSATLLGASLEIGDAIPTPSGRPQDAALTAPGNAPDADADGLLSAHGQASTENVLLVDGAEWTQTFNSVPAGAGSDRNPNPEEDGDAAESDNGPANGLARGRHAGAAYLFAQSAVRETRVATPGYSAQSGHAAGAVVTTVSRSGTQTLHGGASWVIRSQALAAANPLSIATSYQNGVVSSAVVKPHDLRENFGASLGGPLRLTASRAPPRIYFFYALDLQRRGFPAIASPGDPAFYSLTATQIALLATRGVSSSATVSALNYLSSLTGSTPRRADQTINFVRFDWRPHGAAPARHRSGQAGELSLDYNALRWDAPAGLTDAPVVARGRASLGSASGAVDAVLLHAHLPLAAHVSNQVTLSWIRDLQYESPQPNLPQEPAIGPAQLAPEVNISPNGLLFGTPASLSQLAYPKEDRLEFNDILTLVFHHHLVQAGGDIARIADTISTEANAEGTFLYDSVVAKGFAGGLVDFITDYTFNVNRLPNGGCPAITAPTHDFCFHSFTQSFGQTSASFPTIALAGFAEDTWSVRAGLTLHAGVRYEYTLLPLPVAPDFALDALFGARGATSVFPEDRNNLGPRASFAWQPRRLRWSVRGGFGVFYGRLPGATILAALTRTAEPASTTRIRIIPSTETACPQAPANGFGYPCSFLAQPSGIVAATTSAVVFDRHFRLPAVQQGSLSLDRQLPRRTSLSFGYVFNSARQLPSSTDLNIAPATTRATYQLQGGTGQTGVQDGETFVLPLYTTRISPNFGPVTAIESNANATYHALVLAMTSNVTRTLSVRAGYTFSKAIDFGPSASAPPRTDNQLDPFTDGYDKGVSSLNYPSNLNVTAVWQPRPSAGSRLRQALGDWQVSPLISRHSGRPYSFELFGGTYLPGGHSSLNGSGGALYLPTVGRNTLRLPPLVNVDVRAAKSVHLGSPDARYRLRGAAEVFNLLNHVNVSSVTERAYEVQAAANGVTPLVFQNAANIAAEGLNAQPFGTPTAAATSLARERQIQFSLRLEF